MAPVEIYGLPVRATAAVPPPPCAAALLAAALLALLAVSGAHASGCPAGTEPRTVAEMIFGRNIGEVLGVTEEAWARFVDDEITPRFPAGLTVFDAQGQWRDTASGRIVREPGKVLRVILDDDTAQVPRLAEVSDIYKRKFNQQSVILSISTACLSF